MSSTWIKNQGKTSEENKHVENVNDFPSGGERCSSPDLHKSDSLSVGSQAGTKVNEKSKSGSNQVGRHDDKSAAKIS